MDCKVGTRCKADTEVGNVEPLGHAAAGKKDKKNEPRGERPVGCKARTGRLRGTLGGRYSQARRKGVKRERPVGWGARAGSIIWDLKGSHRKPMVYNVQPEYRNTLRGTYAGCLLYTSDAADE